MTDSETLDPAAQKRLRAWGGEKLLKEILRLFLANAPQRMDQIRNGVAGNDAKEVERGAHSLKSTAANVVHHARIVRDKSIKRMVISTASEIVEHAFEDIASTGRLDGLQDRLPEMEEAYARAIRALEAVVKGDAE